MESQNSSDIIHVETQKLDIPSTEKQPIIQADQTIQRFVCSTVCCLQVWRILYSTIQAQQELLLPWGYAEISVPRLFFYFIFLGVLRQGWALECSLTDDLPSKAVCRSFIV